MNLVHWQECRSIRKMLRAQTWCGPFTLRKLLLCFAACRRAAYENGVREYWDGTPLTPESFAADEVRADNEELLSVSLDLWRDLEILPPYAVCDIIREIFNCPSDPCVFTPTDNMPLVLDLAEQIYRDKDFALTPFLADALEEGGCREERILTHLRQSIVANRCSSCKGTGQVAVLALHDRGAKIKKYRAARMQDCEACQGCGFFHTYARHLRGCWALDLVLDSAKVTEAKRVEDTCVVWDV